MVAGKRLSVSLSLSLSLSLSGAVMEVKGVGFPLRNAIPLYVRCSRSRARVCVPKEKQLGAGLSGTRASTRSVGFCQFGSAVGLSTASWDGERNAHQ